MGPVDAVLVGLLLLASWSAYVWWAWKRRFKLLEQKIKKLEDRMNFMNEEVRRLQSYENADSRWIDTILQFPPLREWWKQVVEERALRAEQGEHLTYDEVIAGRESQNQNDISKPTQQA